MTKSLNYGPLFPKNPNTTFLRPIKAAVAFKNLGGKFISKDGTDDFKLAVAGDTEICGWCDTGERTVGSAIENLPVITDLDQPFEMPVDTPFTEADAIALLEKTCDIIVTNGIQYVDYDASATDVLVIVGYDVEEQTLWVKMNPAKRYVTGVA